MLRGDVQQVATQRLGRAIVTAGRRAAVVAHLLDVLTEGGPALVVTPNIHHVAMLENDYDFGAAYESAVLWPADGWPVALAASILSRRWTDRVAGSDLVDIVSGLASRKGFTLAVMGGVGRSSELAAAALRQRYPTLGVVLTDPLPDVDPRSRTTIDLAAERLRAAKPDIIFLGLGAPKQEIFGAALVQKLDKGVVMCVGAGVNFAAGTQRRAPRLARLLGLEWLDRLLREPVRLGRRYLFSAVVFLRVVARSAIQGGFLGGAPRPPAQSEVDGGRPRSGDRQIRQRLFPGRDPM